jgi:hypothetical protein
MAEQGTPERLVEIALAEVGTIEGPKNNETKYGDFTKANFQPWCGSFVMWCADQAGVKVPNSVYTPAGANAFIRKGRWSAANEAEPQAGDIVYFDFPSDGIDRISHVGIVVKDNGDGTVTCVEGNTAPDKKGDQRNGGEVCLKIRAYKSKNRKKLQPNLYVAIVGFGRPKFKKVAAAKTVDEAREQYSRASAKRTKKLK